MRSTAGTEHDPPADAVRPPFFVVGADGSARWGDKTPEYVSHVAAIERHFPRAQFVHIVLDGRDVFLSLSKRRWKDRG